MVHRFFSYLSKHQILFALFLLVAGWFLLQIRGIILSVFLSYIIMSALLPFTARLRKIGMQRFLAVLIPYLIAITIILLLIVPLIPFLITQLQLFFVKFPLYLKETEAAFGVNLDIKQAQKIANDEVNALGQNAFAVTTVIFGGFFSILTVFIISFYMLLYQERFNKFVAQLFHPSTQPKVLETLVRINHKLGAWSRGQVLMSLTIGAMAWIALTLLNIPFALPLALIAGLLEVIPGLGPIIAAVPAAIVAYTISPTTAFTVIIAYIVIQLLENNILIPKIMQKAVGLNPVTVILAITIGANLMGIAGALLAIPFVSFLIVLFQSLEEKN